VRQWRCWKGPPRTPRNRRTAHFHPRRGMQILVISIVAIGLPVTRTEAFGRYCVTLDAGGLEQVLAYTVKLSARSQPVSWTPPDSILSDPSIDVLVVAGVTDLVVAFHRGATIAFPRAVPAGKEDPATAVIRL
jgi:hypothetical protein